MIGGWDSMDQHFQGISPETKATCMIKRFWQEYF